MVTRPRKGMAAASAGLLGMLLGAVPLPALAGYDERDAVRDCEREIVDRYGYQEFRDVDTDGKGHDSYKVTGSLRIKHGDDRSFSCRVKHKEVVSVSVSGRGEGRNDDDDDGDDGVGVGTAAAIGAGVLGLAILGAMAASGDDDGTADSNDSRRSEYRSGNGASPLADRSYLETECRSELQAHIAEDHGAVKRVSLDQSRLDDRTLEGSGIVDFRNGGERHFDFSCEFDRQGRVYDGSYHYWQ
ncbi:MAG: hypothetical protein U1E14_16380 [Geminicoccaceae bacterium]